MATQAQFASIPRIAIAQVTAANTNRDGTGTIVTVIDPVAAGFMPHHVRVVAVGTTTAGMIRFYLSQDAGTTNRLIKEIPVTAITPSATVKTFEAEWDLSDWKDCLPLSDTTLLRASTHNAETFNIFAVGGDLT